jgi:hypothetical protein
MRVICVSKFPVPKVNKETLEFLSKDDTARLTVMLDSAMARLYVIGREYILGLPERA